MSTFTAAFGTVVTSVKRLRAGVGDISPNETGLPGLGTLREIVGGAMTAGLVLSVLAMIISAIVWGFGANSSNPHLSGRGKTGVMVACGAAVICGAAVAIITFFWQLGKQVS